jgi:hypothetical protein
MENKNEEQSAELLNSLIIKAWANPEFKEQLINNPSKTIGDIVGKELGGIMPNGKELIVVDKTDEGK